MKAFRAVTATLVDRRTSTPTRSSSKQFLKRIERTGFGEFLFDWRKDPAFELNQPEAKGART
jgi:3-isopropylmalate dehydratase small subunit